jgi:broad specificity phosphatase PhoE
MARTLRAAAPNFANLVYVSSPLPRARTTMEIVLAELGLPKDY